MDTTRLERDVRFLKGYALVMTCLVGAFSCAGVMRTGSAGADGVFQVERAKITELDVERINVKEPNGQYRLVISNRPRSIGPIYKGKPFGYAGGTRPGLIFFNDEGTENGGLTFTGRKDSTGRYRASTHMSFDQFNQDQILNFDYSDDNGRRVTGISVNDRADLDIYDVVQQRDSIFALHPAGAARNAAVAEWQAGLTRKAGMPLNVQRMFIGRDPSKSAVLNLADANGKARLRLVVDSLGAARIDFLDPNGRVTNSITGR
jgi:hypothetical protein